MLIMHIFDMVRILLYIRIYGMLCIMLYPIIHCARGTAESGSFEYTILFSIIHVLTCGRSFHAYNLPTVHKIKWVQLVYKFICRINASNNEIIVGLSHIGFSTTCCGDIGIVVVCVRCYV